MPREGQSAEAGNNTRHAILKFLKTEGPADAATLAGHLRLTAMAVRQHLYELEDQKFVVAEERPVPLGRNIAPCWERAQTRAASMTGSVAPRLSKRRGR